MDSATQKTRINAGKTASKRVVQKIAEATGDLVGNKVANKITLLGKPTEKTEKLEEIYIPPEKRQQIIYDLKLFWTYWNFKKCKISLTRLLMIKMYQDLLLKNRLKFMINQKKIIMLTKKLELKHQCYD